MKKDVKFSTRIASTDREAIKELAKQSGIPQGCNQGLSSVGG